LKDLSNHLLFPFLFSSLVHMVGDIWASDRDEVYLPHKDFVMRPQAQTVCMWFCDAIATPLELGLERYDDGVVQEASPSLGCSSQA
jgi:hypothetical protein